MLDRRSITGEMQAHLGELDASKNSGVCGGGDSLPLRMSGSDDGGAARLP